MPPHNVKMEARNSQDVRLIIVSILKYVLKISFKLLVIYHIWSKLNYNSNHINIKFSRWLETDRKYLISSKLSK